MPLFADCVQKVVSTTATRAPIVLERNSGLNPDRLQQVLALKSRGDGISSMIANNILEDMGAKSAPIKPFLFDRSAQKKLADMAAKTIYIPDRFDPRLITQAEIEFAKKVPVVPQLP